MTAWIALIIAAGSLGWSVTSTTLSWRKAKVRIMLSVREFMAASMDDNGFIAWLQIIVMNKGGSAVAVTGVGVEFGDGHLWFSQPSPTHRFKSVAIVGPDLPATIEVNHLANWHLDMAWVVGTDLRESNVAVRPYVELSDGSIIKADHAISEWIRTQALAISERRAKYHKNDPPPQEHKLPHHCPQCDLKQQSERIYPLAEDDKNSHKDSSNSLRRLLS